MSRLIDISYTAEQPETHISVNAVTLVVHGRPVPQERPRVVHPPVSSAGGKENHQSRPAPRVFSPSRAVQANFRGAALRGLTPYLRRNNVPIFGHRDIHMYLNFYFKRPMSHFRSNIREREQVKEEYVSAKPFNIAGDIDNHTKFVLDALTQVLYWDDKQVMRLEVEKKYCDDEDERTCIVCYSIGYNPLLDIEWEIDIPPNNPDDL